MLKTWIERGAPSSDRYGNQLRRLETMPSEVTWDRAGEQTLVLVVAHWADGSSEDVTCLCRFFSNDEGVAKISPDGLATTRGRGDTHLITCYDSLVVSIPVTVPWLEVYLAEPKPVKKGDKVYRPKLLGAAELDLQPADDPRVPLMAWLRAQDNPFFSRAFVNRVWAHYFGRGIVNPPDDFNLANPPSNAGLLDYLAAGFVDHGYNMQWLHREIVGSRAYQARWQTNSTNATDERNFSRAVLRRLPAEVAVDAMLQATANAAVLSVARTNMTGRRIAVHPTADLARTEYPLAVFGKPLRMVNCDCEREQEASLLQSIFMRNDQDLLAMLARPDGWLEEISRSSDRNPLIEEAYLRTVSRRPTAAELDSCRNYLAAAPSLASGMNDLLWALLNTQEFITNH